VDITNIFVSTFLCFWNSYNWIASRQFLQHFLNYIIHITYCLESASFLVNFENKKSADARSGEYEIPAK